MSYKIVIKGGYGLTNFGDDALMYVLASKLKPYFQNHEIAFACYDNEHNKAFSNGFNIESVNRFKAIKTDLLLFGGGTQFYSFLPPRSKIRFYLSTMKRIVKNPISIFQNSSPQIHQNGFKHIASLGIGVGPFLPQADTTPAINAKEFFSQMDFVAVRDTSSLDQMKKWDIKDSKLYTDICYLLESNHYVIKKTAIKKIGIAVRDWDLTSEGHAYYKKIFSLVKKLEAKDYEITLIIFAKKSDKFWSKHKDKFTNVLEWEYNQISIEEFMQQLSAFDLIITARYHGAVFASLLNIPFISIVVEQKLSLISEVYEGASEKWEYPFDIQDCLIKIEKMNTDYTLVTNRIEEISTHQRTIATQMFLDLISYCISIGILSKGEK